MRAEESTGLYLRALTLNRETVRTLAPGELAKAAGGLADSHDPCAAATPLASPL